jgi:hypothetical protein
MQPATTATTTTPATDIRDWIDDRRNREQSKACEESKAKRDTEAALAKARANKDPPPNSSTMVPTVTLINLLLFVSSIVGLSLYK